MLFASGALLAILFFMGEARALGKAEDKAVWTPDASSPMSETEFNWDRRQG